MTPNDSTADDGPPLADPVVNFYRAASHAFGMSRTAADRLRETAGIVTFKIGRERFIRRSTFENIVAAAEAAEAAKRSEAA